MRAAEVTDPLHAPSSPPHTPRPHHLFTGSPPLEHTPSDSKDRQGPPDTCHENPRMQEECQDRRGRATAQKSLATGRGMQTDS